MSGSLLIVGATILDGVADRPLEGRAIWIEGPRIKAIGHREAMAVPKDVRTLDASGKFAIPGLMNANVHLLAGALLPGNIVRYSDRLQEVAAEAAQVALKNGLTTVFDTMGPRKPLIAVRDRINRGELRGSRFFCAGWIVGLDGIFSLDFIPRGAEIFPAALVERINGLCVENVGPLLSWMAPEQLAHEVREYMARGIDFLKFAANEHRTADPTSSLIFSPRAQAVMVEEAHKAGLTAQAHTTSVEGLHAAIEAECDIIQHCNITGPFAIPEATLELMVRRKTGAVIFPFTRRRFDWIMANSESARTYRATMNSNCRLLVEAGALIMLANDGAIWGPDLASDPNFARSWFAPGEDDLSALDHGHFVWLKAMEEMGMPPMEMLRAATRNIAVAYRKDRDLGTLEPGKIADVVLLEQDPLQSAAHYRSIHAVLKEGVVVNRDSLPSSRILTLPQEPDSAEALAYRSHRHIGRSALPTCPTCR